MGDRFQLSFSDLADFSKHADLRVKYFSGTATYRKTIRVDAKVLAPHHRILLDLGTMNDIATVKVNGSPEKVLCTPLTCWTSPALCTPGTINWRSP